MNDIKRYRFLALSYDFSICEVFPVLITKKETNTKWPYLFLDVPITGSGIYEIDVINLEKIDCGYSGTMVKWKLLDTDYFDGINITGVIPDSMYPSEWMAVDRVLKSYGIDISTQ